MKRNVGLFRACLIVANLMVGAGVFINIKPLVMYAGPWGFLAYIAGVVILLPIIISLSTLASVHAVAGGLLVYGKKYIHPSAGFLSAWSYFVAKSVSAALLSHVLITPIYMNVHWLNVVPQWFITYSFMLMLVLINIAGVRLGGRIQWLFTAIKVVPFFTVIVSAILRGGWSTGGLWSICGYPDIISSIPIALFALSGFEVVCSIGHMIKNPEINARRAAVWTALTVAGIYSAFQFCAYKLVGNSIVSATKPLEFLAMRLGSFASIGHAIDDFMLASVFSGAFGLLTNNCWNLYALAKENFFPGSRFLCKLSRSGVPWVALIVEVGIACIILTISVNQIALQNMTVFAMFLSFAISTLAAMIAFRCNGRLFRFIPVAAFCCCGGILVLCFRQLIASGVSFGFLSVFLAGVVAALFHRFYNYFLCKKC